MEQRRLRLGDILDDYCPRERRLTNHAVVAMVEEDVKQTRCTTCDAEHVYKGGKAPRRKKADGPSKLYKQVLAGLTDQDPTAVQASPREDVHDEIDEQDDEPADDVVEVIAEVVAREPVLREEPVLQADADEQPEEDVDDDRQPLDDGPVHRPLIRAQLPRTEATKIERQPTDFTIRQNNGRGGNGHFRGGQGPSANNNNNGQRFGRGPHRGGAGGGGRNGGANQGFGRGPSGGNQPRQGGPRKRSR